jgi:DNA recombination protein RmuC
LNVPELTVLHIIVLLLVGGALGAVVAWGLASSRALSAHSHAIRDAEQRAAAAGARSQELRAQLDAADREAMDLRTQLGASERARATAEAQATAAAQALDEARSRLTDAFKALASEALAGSSHALLQLAEERFRTLREESVGDLDARRQSIQTLVAPLQQALDVYQREVRDLEQRRDQVLGGVGEQLRQVAESHTRLQSETSRLVAALRAPNVRGRWGEIALRRTAELAGMSSYCDFTEQELVQTDTGRVRPDMIVRLPAERTIVVDSKVPLSAYLDAIDAPDEAARAQALARHAQQVRQHVSKLVSRSYAAEIASSAEFVVLFIPNDSILAAAAEKDPELVDWALDKRVVLATPATLVALLRAVAYGWRQAQVAEHAQRINDIGRELRERLAVLVDHLSRIGGSIGKAVDAYNQAVGSLESRVMPTVRKLEQLEAGATREPASLEPVEQAVRQLTPGRLELE